MSSINAEESCKILFVMSLLKSVRHTINYQNNQSFYLVLSTDQYVSFQVDREHHQTLDKHSKEAECCG